MGPLCFHTGRQPSLGKDEVCERHRQEHRAPFGANVGSHFNTARGEKVGARRRPTAGAGSAPARAASGWARRSPRRCCPARGRAAGATARRLPGAPAHLDCHTRTHRQQLRASRKCKQGGQVPAPKVALPRRRAGAWVHAPGMQQWRERQQVVRGSRKTLCMARPHLHADDAHTQHSNRLRAELRTCLHARQYSAL